MPLKKENAMATWQLYCIEPWSFLSFHQMNGADLYMHTLTDTHIYRPHTLYIDCILRFSTQLNTSPHVVDGFV